MKRILVMVLAIMMVVSLCACSSDSAEQKKSVTGGSKTVSDVLNQGEATEAPAAAATQAKSSINAPSTDVDIDLTALSSTLVYSEVLNMLQSPDEYMGKSVRMSGSFAVAEGDGRMYYACIIKDATACCSNGIEFLWDGDHSYPADYPAVGTDITVVGEFDKYYEGENMYIQLINAQLSF